MSHTHYKLICENCEAWLGGCRCMSQDKKTEKAGLCKECSKKANSEKENKSEK